jgi:hypothetical protein
MAPKKKTEAAAEAAPVQASEPGEGGVQATKTTNLPQTAFSQPSQKPEEKKKLSAQKERFAKAAEFLASKATQAGFGVGCGLIIPHIEKGSGKVVPAIVSELRLRPAVGFKPGESQVEAVCLVLSAHTSRTYTVHIPIPIEEA